jgi:PTS system galactitol-specific IIA component
MTPIDASLFKPELVFFDDVSHDRETVFRMIEPQLRDGGYVDEGWLEAVIAREASYPTGLVTKGAQIAIPHTDPCFVLKPYVAIVRPTDPIEFEAMAGMGGDVSAQLIINLGITSDGAQVEMLQGLMNLFMDASVVAGIMAQTTGEGMVRAFTDHLVDNNVRPAR